MNKTLTINIGGRVFYVDEDAYKLLYDYLYNLKHAFARQEGSDEILDDLEDRLSELLLERLSTRQEVVTLQSVEETIARLGKPEEIAGENEFETAGNTSPAANGEKAHHEDAPQAGKTEKEVPKEEHATPPPFEVRKRLFRDPDNRMLGGVLGGLAHYLGWDPTFLRLLTVFLMLFYGIVILLYLICWLVIPLATTASDKLSMHGRQVTIENIGKVVTDSFDSAGRKVDKAMDNMKVYIRSDKPRTTLQRVADCLVNIIGALLTIALAIIAILLSPLVLFFLFITIILLLAFLIICVSGITGLYSTFPSFAGLISTSPTITIICYACLFIGLTLLLVCLVSSIFHWAFKWKSFSPRTTKILLGIGFICLLTSGIITVMLGAGLVPLHRLIDGIMFQ